LVNQQETVQKKDRQGITFGMWLFLYTEIMLFGGLFILYAAYHQEYNADFIEAAKELSLTFGTINTIILLCSSFAVAASITAIRQKSQNLALIFLCSAIGLGTVFLFNKYLEWSHKIALDIYPNSATLTSGKPGVNIFFGLYYLITGLHGLHVLIGMILLTVCAVQVKRKKITYREYGLLDNGGLYWHLVDLIWIFVFPLFYLVA